VRRRRWSLVGLLVLMGCLGACANARTPSALHPAGSGADDVNRLWWLLFTIATAVCVIVIGLVLVAVLRRRRDDARPNTTHRRAVIVTGVAIPAVILTTVYAFGLHDQEEIGIPSAPGALTIDVVGHLWWWEVRYPDQGIVTANEIHVPVGQIVKVRLTTADVNHSFWVPQLMPKTDLIAGRVNQTWLQANRPGTFHGQCAEYCGLQHAHMALVVVAQPAGQFQSWAALQSQDEPTATTAQEAAGLQVFESSSCASCHTVRGTTAHGRVGPDLTHLGSRSYLGAGTVPNTTGYLGGWISNAQALKPGNKMPPQPLSPDELRAVIAWLDAGRGVPPGGPAATSSPTSGTTPGGTGGTPGTTPTPSGYSSSGPAS
jgi:cytochrome c oxidase subunit II